MRAPVSGTNLAVVVTSPAAKTTGCQQGAVVIGATGRQKSDTRKHFRGTRGIGTIGCRAVSELPIVIAAPASDAPARHEGTRMHPSDGNCLHATKDRNRWCVGLGSCGAVAELPIAIVAPATYVAVVHESAGVDQAR